MQSFTIPQFIDVEDKVISFVTVRQFLILLADLVVSVITYALVDFSLFLALAIVYLIVFGTFAFVRINGRPFHFFILNFIQSIKKPQLRVWKHNNAFKDMLFSEENSQGNEIQPSSSKAPIKPHPAGSRLRELSLIVDTKGVYKGGGDEEIIF